VPRTRFYRDQPLAADTVGKVCPWGMMCTVYMLYCIAAELGVQVSCAASADDAVRAAHTVCELSNICS